jgi:hypothetical protein
LVRLKSFWIRVAPKVSGRYPQKSRKDTVTGKIACEFRGETGVMHPQTTDPREQPKLSDGERSSPGAIRLIDFRTVREHAVVLSP